MTGPNFPERVISEEESIKAGLSVARFTINQADGMIDLLNGNEFVIKFKLKQPLQKDAQIIITPRFEMDARQFFI